MSPAMASSLTSRLLKPLIHHLTRPRPRPRPRPLSRPPNNNKTVLEVTKRFAKDVWRSTFGGLESGRGGGRVLPAWETIPLRRRGGGGRVLPNGKPWPGGNTAQYRRDLHTTRTTTPTSSPFTQYSRAWKSRTRTTLTPWQPRGPGLVSQPGLHPSPSRTFATYGGGHHAGEVLWNVPVGMRAIADRLRKRERERERERDDSRPSSRRKNRNKIPRRANVKGQVVQALWKKYGLVAAASSSSSSSSGNKSSSLLVVVQKNKEEVKRMNRAREYKRLFIDPQQPEQARREREHVRVVEDARVAGSVEEGKKVDRVELECEVDLEMDLEVERTRDPRRTTYLLLPLAPSLSHLLSLETPTPTSTPFGQIDTDSFSSSSYFHPHTPLPLLHPLPTLSNSTPFTSTHLIPLLTRLSHHVTLGSTQPSWWKTEETVDVEVVRDHQGGEESMRLTFRGWSADGVRRLVRRLVGNEGGEDAGVEWCYVYEVTESHPVRLASTMMTTSTSSLSDLSVLLSSTTSSYAPTIVSDHSDHSDDLEDEQTTDQLLSEEQTAWRMPLLNELGGMEEGFVGGDSLGLSVGLEGWDEDEMEVEVEMDLGRVEGRVWAD